MRDFEARPETAGIANSIQVKLLAEREIGAVLIGMESKSAAASILRPEVMLVGRGQRDDCAYVDRIGAPRLFGCKIMQLLPVLNYFRGSLRAKRIRREYKADNAWCKSVWEYRRREESRRSTEECARHKNRVSDEFKTDFKIVP
jgi:hypothetical protein